MSTIVRIYHNAARDPMGRSLGLLDGYQPGHPVVLVDEYEEHDTARLQRGGTVINYLEDIFHTYNVGDDPEFGTPQPRAVAYRQRRNRSLSMGDVVGISTGADIAFWACAGQGWEQLARQPKIVEWNLRGTTSYLSPFPSTDPR